MAAATSVAIGGLALSAGSTAMNFIQAGEQKSKQRQAEAAAAAAMAEARKKLEINFTDELAVNKEPYELQRESMLSQGATAIQAGQESERGSVATAGKVQMAQNEAQAGIRTAMGAEMTDIQNKKIQEASRLRDLGAQLDLGEAEGAQMAAANAEEAATAHTAQGMQGVISTAQQGLNMIPLFAKDGSITDFTTGGGQLTISDRSGKKGGVVNMTDSLSQSSAFDQYPSVGSDRRLKKNIAKIGESLSGLNIYSFEYIDEKFGEGVFQGAMSDEAPQNAVSKGIDGFDRVNYSLLDIEFKKI